MPIKRWVTFVAIFSSLCLTAKICHSEPYNAGLGQSIQIHTRLDSFIGRPSWLLILRDIDHGQNIPYLFDFTQENNFWIALSFNKNYLIVASELQLSRYRGQSNDFRNYKIRNFCNLETNGRIIRGESLRVVIEGKLTPNPDTMTCNVTRMPDSHFTVVPANES